MPAVPPRTAYGSPMPPPRNTRVPKVPVVPTGSSNGTLRSRGHTTPTLEDKLVSPRIRISASADDDAPVFDRPIGQEAAEDTPLKKHEPFSSSPGRPVDCSLPPQPLSPLTASPPSPARAAGSRLEKAEVVHWQPKHYLPAPLPRPNQSNEDQITSPSTLP